MPSRKIHSFSAGATLEQFKTDAKTLKAVLTYTGRSSNLTGRRLRPALDLIRWNHIAFWLKQIDDLRQAA
jgi:hypothetical protein